MVLLVSIIKQFEDGGAKTGIKEGMENCRERRKRNQFVSVESILFEVMSMLFPKHDNGKILGLVFCSVSGLRNSICVCMGSEEESEKVMHHSYDLRVCADKFLYTLI